MSKGDVLGQVAIFADLAEDVRERLISHSSSLQIRAGEWLFRQGEQADRLYVVRSGRLEVVSESPEPAVIRVLGPGRVLGELALLTDSVRSASVRARRDSELILLARADFTGMLSADPILAQALCRSLGRQLSETRGTAIEQPLVPATIAVVPLQRGLPVAELTRILIEEMRRRRTAVLLSSKVLGAGGDDRSYAACLDRSEADAEQVLMVTDEPGSREDWTGFCLRQADRVLALVGDDAPAHDLPQSLRGCDVVYCPGGQAPMNSACWLEALQPRSTYVLASGARFIPAARRVARRLAGTSVGIVLSGGGARGLAHIGVVEELLGAGIEIDRVAGCSMGSFIGAQLAAGASPEDIEATCRAELVEANPWSDYTVPLVAATRGRRLGAMLQRTFRSHAIESLERHFFCVSADLISARLIVHDRGPIAAAVAASMCMPGSVPPISSDGHLLVDGGVFDNLPVEPMAAFGEGPIIAVDVTAQFRMPTVRETGRPRALRLRAGIRSAVVGDPGARPSLRETIFRSIVLGSSDTTRAAKQFADLVISPATSSIGLLAFNELDRARELGRQAARAALEQDPSPLA
jgi:NTE family protein